MFAGFSVLLQDLFQPFHQAFHQALSLLTTLRIGTGIWDKMAAEVSSSLQGSFLSGVLDPLIPAASAVLHGLKEMT